MKLNLRELRERYVVEGRSLPADVEQALAEDPRPGALAVLEAVRHKRAQNRAEGRRLKRMLVYERALWSSGIERVAGVDEAGAGPLAGPVAAAAVILAPGTRIPDVDDSKKLDEKTRERLADTIRSVAVAWSTVLVDPEEIDRLNIYWACIAAMERAVGALRPAPERVLVDARPLKGLSMPYEAIVKGDGKSLSIAAASILAKTTRDRLMVELDQRYPGYGFAQHKGYPVPEHRKALRRLGPCPIHRRSFDLSGSVQHELDFGAL